MIESYGRQALIEKNLEWGGCVTGVAGALLLSLNNAYSGWGFVLFLASNACWFGYGYLSKTHGISAMNVAYTATSLLGIWRWF